MEIDFSEFIEEFKDDMTDLLGNYYAGLLNIKKRKDDINLINEIFRAAHSIKGMAAAMEFKNMENLTHKMEDLLYEVRDTRIVLTDEIIDLLINGYFLLGKMLVSIENIGTDEDVDKESIAAIIKELLRLSGKETTHDKIEAEAEDIEMTNVVEVLKRGKRVVKIVVFIDEESPFKGVRAFMVLKEIKNFNEVVIIQSIPDAKCFEKDNFIFEKNEVNIFIEENSEKIISSLLKKISNISEIKKVHIEAIDNEEDIMKKDIYCEDKIDKNKIKEEKTEEKNILELELENCEEEKYVVDESMKYEIFRECEEKFIEIEMNIFSMEDNFERENALKNINYILELISEMLLLTDEKIVEELIYKLKKALNIKLLSSEAIKEIEDMVLDSSIFIKKISDNVKILKNDKFILKLKKHMEIIENYIESHEQKAEKHVDNLLREKLKLKDDDIEELKRKQKEKYPDLKIEQIAVKEKKVSGKEMINALKDKKNTEKPHTHSQEMHENIKIPAVKADKLIDMLEELIIAQAQIEQEMNKNRNIDINLIKNMNGIFRITKEIQNLSISFRMVTLKNTFQKVKMTFRDTIKKMDKKVSLDIEGEETEIDRIIADKLVEPMIHLVKNSISHGIESEEQRIKSGKNPEGSVKIITSADKGYVYIVIEDDGGGINIDRVYSKAREKNIIDINKKYSENEIVNFIFLPGFSTAEKVDAISGRGVGMDVVRTEIYKLGGRIDIDNNPGQGCSFILRVPQNMTALNGTVVHIKGENYVIPTNYIKEIFSFDEEKFVKIQGNNEMIKLRDNIITLVKMEKYFNEKFENERLGIVLETDKRVKALPVDKIIERREFVVKPLGDEFEGLKHIFGATILGNGKPAVILDIENIFANE